MKRNTWILLAILVVLAIATFVVMQQPGEVSSTGSSGKTLVSYDSSAVDKLEIISTKLAVTLERQGGKWMLTSPLRYQANESFVTEAVGKGKHLEISKPVSSNPENQFKFEVDTTGTRVQVYERGALKSVFFVGKAGPSFTETYIRAAGSNEVYLTNGAITSTFNRRLEDWRDKTVFKTEQEGIKSVRFTYGDTTFTLALKDSSWRIGSDSTVESTVKSFLSTLANVQTDEFVDSALADVPKMTGAIEVNGIQLRFHANKDATKYFVQTSDAPQWYVLQQWRVTQLLKRKKEFLPATKA